VKLYTADTHFNHEGIRRQYRTHWESVDAMNQALIDNWNAVVRPGDLVYHLGDFALRSRYNAWDIDFIISQLKGQIILIRGNHDDKNMKQYEEWFVKVDYLAYIKEEDGSKIMLCHYPMRSWRTSIHGSFHLHGHCHGKIEPHGRSQDVGMDVIGFAPIRWEPIKEMILKREKEKGFEYSP
jgi:calcineurin-like phosphoesterase family protein